MRALRAPKRALRALRAPKRALRALRAPKRAMRVEFGLPAIRPEIGGIVAFAGFSAARRRIDESFPGPAVTSLRLGFIGDSIVNGTGDATMLGWTGRVCAIAANSGHDITHYDLGVRGETSRMIRARWRNEAACRLPETFKAALVFSFGINDCVHLDGSRRVSPEESLSNARVILTEAKKWRPTLFIGPTPIDRRERAAQFYPGVNLSLDCRDIALLNRGLIEAAVSVGVPALDLFDQLESNAEWTAGIKDGDGVHPTARGYAQMAHEISRWPAWQALFTAG